MRSPVATAGGLFAIDANTGVVTVDGAIDRERAAPSMNIDGDGDVAATARPATQTFTINVSDVDEFDVTAPVDTNAAANAVTENAADGTVVGVTALGHRMPMPPPTA